MTISQVKKMMAKYNISQTQICRDLAFNKGDLSAYLKGTKELPKARAAAFDYYFLSFQEK